MSKLCTDPTDRALVDRGITYADGRRTSLTDLCEAYYARGRKAERQAIIELVEAARRRSLTEVDGELVKASYRARDRAAGVVDGIETVLDLLRTRDGENNG